MEGQDGNGFDTIKVCTSFKGKVSLSVTMSQAEKTEMVDKARTAIVMCLKTKF